jgi:hypothetical protein
MNRLRFFIIMSIILVAMLACNIPVNRTQETEPDIAVVETTEVTDPASQPVEETEVTETEPPLLETTEVSETEPPFACPALMVPTLAFNVEFCHPSAISTSSNVVLVPENPSTPDIPPWTINPETIEITLTDYPILNQYHDPIVYIYPVADFIALNPDVGPTVANLQSLLATQPPDPTSIPFLPIFNAAQMMHAKVTYFSFRNGNGVRFITQYGQAFLPINNKSAIYVFVGLTADGQHLISATFPVNHPLFEPDDMTEPAEGWEAFSNNYESYVNTLEANLALQPENTFTPDISILDSMMASFLIPVDAVP